MKKIAIPTGVFLLAAFAATPVFAADASVDAMVKTFTAAFNKGDMKTVKAMHTASPTIVDEMGPHFWSGASAFDQWAADLGKWESGQGITGGQPALYKPTRVEVNGDHAYVVTPSSYSFEQNGRKMRERAEMTMVLAKDAGVWKVASWTWTGQVAAPVK